jgi:hypothetical protein
MSKKVGLHVTHEVKNYADWKVGFDSDETNRAAIGVKITGVYTAHDNENLVTITSEVPSVEAAQGFINNPMMKETMEKAGVISAPQISIVMIQN